MDKSELIDRINAARESLRIGATVNARHVLSELSHDLGKSDVWCVGSGGATGDGGPVEFPMVDHFQEWLASPDGSRYQTEDYSRSNPKLHELYTNWAHHHLLLINKAIRRLDRFNNGNLLDVLSALHKCRRDLIVSDAAYRDAAARILAEIPPNVYTEGSTDE